MCLVRVAGVQGGALPIWGSLEEPVSARRTPSQRPSASEGGGGGGEGERGGEEG